MSDIDTHVRRAHPIIFGLIALWAIIEGSITSYLVAKFNSNNSYPNNSFRDRLKFAVFVSWWTVVFSIAYLVFFQLGSGGVISSVASHGIWLFVTWVFWLAVAASITSMLGGGKRCSHSDLLYCNQNVAAQAFAWIEWITVTVAFIVVIILGARAIRRGDRVSGPIAA